ncbi:MAG: hypothetical protein M3Q97_08070 [Bacteroidota bacterium]|nr:hypothetical protein [Bacteroidota bacterium]
MEAPLFADAFTEEEPFEAVPLEELFVLEAEDVVFGFAPVLTLLLVAIKN